MTNVGVPMAYWVWAQAGEILTDLSDFKEHDLVYECHCDAIHDDVTGDGISLSSSFVGVLDDAADVADGGVEFGSKKRGKKRKIGCCVSRTEYGTIRAISTER